VLLHLASGSQSAHHLYNILQSQKNELARFTEGESGDEEAEEEGTIQEEVEITWIEARSLSGTGPQ